MLNPFPSMGERLELGEIMLRNTKKTPKPETLAQNLRLFS